MREVTQTEEINVRGRKVNEKITAIIKSGKAREILLEDEYGHILLTIPSTLDQGFLAATLNTVKGIIDTIKRCKLVVTRKQMLLFDSR